MVKPLIKGGSKNCRSSRHPFPPLSFFQLFLSSIIRPSLRSFFSFFFSSRLLSRELREDPRLLEVIHFHLNFSAVVCPRVIFPPPTSFFLFPLTICPRPAARSVSFVDAEFKKQPPPPPRFRVASRYSSTTLLFLCSLFKGINARFVFATRQLRHMSNGLFCESKVSDFFSPLFHPFPTKSSIACTLNSLEA